MGERYSKSQSQPICCKSALSVFLITSDGVDYSGRSSVISIPANTTRVRYPISTIQDTFVEQNDYFKATLSHPITGPAVLGFPTMAFIEITEDDGRLTHNLLLLFIK